MTSINSPVQQQYFSGYNTSSVGEVTNSQNGKDALEKLNELDADRSKAGDLCLAIMRADDSSLSLHVRDAMALCQKYGIYPELSSDPQQLREELILSLNKCISVINVKQDEIISGIGRTSLKQYQGETIGIESNSIFEISHAKKMMVRGNSFI